MPFWTYQNLAQVTQGTWLIPPPPEVANALVPAALNPTGPILWHDTREIQPGQVYLALTGENFDGHDFIQQAFAAGAAMAIVEKQPPSLEGGAGGRVASADIASPESDTNNAESVPSDIRHPTSPILLVENSEKALQQLARAYRAELTSGGCTVIGIAGSNGKTTTRHLIHHVLTHAGKRGTQSPKSFNNHLGVPLTLLAARPTDDFVACEIGTNHPGEIDFLAEIAKPDIAVITSIGEEHLEFFEDLEGVAEEESSILKYVTPQGTAITPGQLDIAQDFGLSPKWVEVLANGIEHIVLGEFDSEFTTSTPAFFGPAVAFSQSKIPQTLQLNSYGVNYAQKEIGTCELSLPGVHNLINASYAALVAIKLGLRFKRFAPAFSNVISPSGRGEHLQFDGVRVIHDAYNANPDSVRWAIELLADCHKNLGERRVIVLGDMFELGDRSDDAHLAVIDALSQHDPTADYGQGRQHPAAIDQVILIGKSMCKADTHIRTRWCRSGRGHLHCFPQWTDRTPGEVADLLQPGDTVLLKASRGMRLERLIPAIELRFGKAQG